MKKPNPLNLNQEVIHATVAEFRREFMQSIASRMRGALFAELPDDVKSESVIISALISTYLCLFELIDDDEERVRLVRFGASMNDDCARIARAAVIEANKREKEKKEASNAS